MTIRKRPYNRSTDYQRINDFLTETHRTGLIPNWLQPRWEYMHFHPYLDSDSLHRFGVWEDEGRIVAVVHFEDRLGVAYFQVRPGYEHLKPEMLAHAEEHLRGPQEDGSERLVLWIHEADEQLAALARERGFTMREDARDVVSQFLIPDPFPEIPLPEGFRLISLAEENDLYKVNRVLWRGFDHPGPAPEEPEDIADRRLMQQAPNYRLDLNVVVRRPDGEFASYCGMWYNPVHRYGYVEPVATDPDYRMRGLGRAAVLEGIRRCAELGAQVAYVTTDKPFYLSMGFRPIYTYYAWVKRYEPGA